MRRPPRKDADLIIVLRRVILKEQDHICPICNGAVPERWIEGDIAPSLEHVIPIKLGGRDEVGNLFVTHKLCNGKKGDRMPTGCELIWLMAVNARLGVGPQEW